MRQLKNKVIILFLGFLTLIFVFLSIVSVHAQQVFIVDNNFNAPTGSNVFTTLQEAADAAELNPGVDIIQVKPSSSNYGSISINTTVILEGIGFNLTKDFALSSRVANITLTDRADGSDNASGTIIRGLIFEEMYLGVHSSSNPYVLSDVIVENCMMLERIINNSNYEPIDNLEIRYCDLRNGPFSSDLEFHAIDNSTIRNCIIDGRIGFYETGASVNTITNNLIYADIYVEAFDNFIQVLNNYFVGTNGSYAFYFKFRNGVVSDNVFYGRAARCTSCSGTFTGNNFSNNLTFNTLDDVMPPPSNSGIDNLEGQNPLFVNSVPLENAWSSSHDFTLDPSSPLFQAINGIKDIGIQFGAHPFTQPNIELRTTSMPTIEVLNSTAIVNPGDNLNIRVKVKGN